VLRVLRSLLRRPLNLDSAAPCSGVGVQIDTIEGRPIPRATTWRLIKLILVQAVKDGACAVRLSHDGQEGSSLGYCFCREGKYDWYEMVAPPADMVARMIDLVRRRCGISTRGHEGQLPLVYQSRPQTARCDSREPTSLLIRFDRTQPAAETDSGL
jgi:hypothetical protein